MPCPRLHRGQGFAALLSVRFICLTVLDLFSFGPVGGARRVVSPITPWLKRDGGFATQQAAKTAGREDAKKMKNLRQPDRPHIGTMLVGQNAEKPTRQ